MDIWWRNPEPYIRELLEVSATKFLFYADYLERRSIDVERFVDLFLAPPLNYRVLIVAPSGTAELQRGWTRAQPKAVYPTWDYKLDDIATLEELIVSPVGTDWAACNDSRCPVQERPVYGQEHRVVVTGCPAMSLGIGRRFASTLRDLQEEYPQAILHVAGLGSFRIMFGFGYGSVDWDPFEASRGNTVVLPNGKKVLEEDLGRWQKWLALLGFTGTDLKIPRNRTLYNVRSAEWAADHFREDVAFRTRGRVQINPDAINHKIPTTLSPMSKQVTATVGDKVVCSSCTLASSCKYFRVGQVCSLPGSETASLTHLFRSRDPDLILDGLGSILTLQIERLENAAENEEEFGGPKDSALDPEVTRLANSIFDRGATLAKMLAPKRFSTGAKVAINLGSGGEGQVVTPQAMVAGIVQELKSQGFSDEQITPELVTSLIEQKSGASERPALPVHVDAEVVDDGDEDPDDSTF